uniref:Sperm microtubule inner protein 6 n=1 Tax=Chelonoidis abingdonii TaxID=106734 RepID=A0A8C0G6T7_CHEAB
METILRGMPMEYPPKPDRLNNYEREVVVNMLNSLSRSQLPSVQHRSTIPGRKPFQGYYSPCTGRHYCLRGMDYYVDGAPCNERQLNQLVEKIVRFGGLPEMSEPGHLVLSLTTPLRLFQEYPILRWDTSHFQKAGGPQKDNYVIHPEFVSESYPTSPCW